MKKYLFIFFIFLASYSFADQLAYITKEQADRAVQVITKLKTLTLFCGCCDMEQPIVVKPTKVFTRHTNYEDYYEVFIEYTNKEGKVVVEPLDLAYVWGKKRGKMVTIGKMLDLEHDFCVHPKNWKKPIKKED